MGVASYYPLLLSYNHSFSVEANEYVYYLAAYYVMPILGFEPLQH